MPGLSDSEIVTCEVTFCPRLHDKFRPLLGKIHRSEITLDDSKCVILIQNVVNKGKWRVKKYEISKNFIETILVLKTQESYLFHEGEILNSFNVEILTET